MRVLVVKTTSMGDVVHALPAVSDIAAALPDVRIDWLVERPFDAIVALHPAIDRVLPIAWRRWRKRLFERATWSEMGALRRRLCELRYDLVIDMQGLVKSALWAKQARGPRAGYDRASIWEPLASLTYDRTAAVSPSLHAIDRCRRLAAAHLGYALPDTAPRFRLRAPAGAWQPQRGPLAVLNPNASVDSKLWPQGHWIELARALRDRGLHVVVMWGSQVEAARAKEIAAACDGEVPPFLSIADAAAVLAAARVVVGLDTGFTHLAAALGAPTIGLFRDHEPSEVGVTGDAYCRSLGGIGKTPGVGDVIAALPPQA
jgi:heptosyltransferase-1